MPSVQSYVYYQIVCLYVRSILYFDAESCEQMEIPGLGEVIEEMKLTNTMLSFRTLEEEGVVELMSGKSEAQRS